MSDLNFDTTEAKPLTIKTRTPEGEEVVHTFEVLTLTKGRFDAITARAREMAKVEKEPDADQAAMMAELCDSLTKSTNGPATITDLWVGGELPAPWLAKITQALLQEAIGGDPPA